MQILAKLNLLDKNYIKRTKEGVIFSLDLRDHIQKYIFWYGGYEKKELEILKRIISGDAVFFDIGANIGTYSLIVATYIHEKGSVHSFEPSDKIINQLKQNTSLNRLTNIKLNRLVVSNRDHEKANLFLADNDNLGMTGLKPSSNFSDNIENVETITIDHYIQTNQIDRIDIVKMDIEGHELMALQGMQHTLSQFKPLLMIELRKKNLLLYHTTTKEIYDFLESFNYKPYKIISDREIEAITDKNTEADIVLFSCNIHSLNNRLIIRG